MDRIDAFYSNWHQIVTSSILERFEFDDLGCCNSATSSHGMRKAIGSISSHNFIFLIGEMKIEFQLPVVDSWCHLELTIPMPSPKNLSSTLYLNSVWNFSKNLIY